MLDELAAALAHELNQPVTAILSNAQAAHRFIADEAIEVDELHDPRRQTRRWRDPEPACDVSNTLIASEAACLNDIIREVQSS
jgi:signal transduction histidine kinase